MKIALFKFFCLVSLQSAAVFGRNAASTSASTSTLASASASARAFLPRSGSSKTTTITVGRSQATDKAAVAPILNPRGGACSDTTPVMFAKLGTTALLESASLFGILWASVKIANSEFYPSWIPTVINEPLVELLASFVVIFASALVGAIVDGSTSAATRQVLAVTKVAGEENWYSNLKKPSWNPPGWVFPIMWLIVSKPTQLCAMSRILKFGLRDSPEASWMAIAVYTTHLALGDTWNKVFFGLECVAQGTVVISLFFAALLTSAYLFYNIDATAGLYMLPTCGWVAVATALQYSIYFLNK